MRFLIAIAVAMLLCGQPLPANTGAAEFSAFIADYDREYSQRDMAARLLDNHHATVGGKTTDRAGSLAGLKSGPVEPGIVKSSVKHVDADRKLAAARGTIEATADDDRSTNPDCPGVVYPGRSSGGSSFSYSVETC